jgi:hypothetical protein
MGQALPVLLLGIDNAWQRLSSRALGLTDDEYRWQPTAGCWTIRGDGPIGSADWADPDPDPAPVTTIAWRMWHIGSDCLASYVSPSLGDWPLAVRGRDWPTAAEPGLAMMQAGYAAFRERMSGLGEDGLWRALGPAWGSFAESSWADLAVHALNELAHHGAEVALLRDLYRTRG